MRAIEKEAAIPFYLLSEKDLMQEGEVEALRRHAEAQMVGADEVAIGRAIAVMSDALGVDAPGEDALLLYYELLGEIPADLLSVAVAKILREYRWNKFPKIADFIEAVRKETEERKRVLRLLAHHDNRARMLRSRPASTR